MEVGIVLTEAAGTPRRIPVIDGVFDIPVGWYDSQGTGVISAPVATIVADSIALIPDSMISALSGQPQGNYGTGKLRMFLGQDQNFLRAQHESTASFAGIYDAPSVGGGSIWTNSFVATIDSLPVSTVLLHEYGHHLDATYGRFILGLTSTSGLSDGVGASGLRRSLPQCFTDALPTIPAGLYGKSKLTEWFAEIWTVQLYPSYTGGGGGTSPTLYQALCGDDISIMRDVRREFKHLVPDMPPFAGGIYD